MYGEQKFIGVCSLTKISWIYHASDFSWCCEWKNKSKCISPLLPASMWNSVTFFLKLFRLYSGFRMHPHKKFQRPFVHRFIQKILWLFFVCVFLLYTKSSWSKRKWKSQVLFVCHFTALLFMWIKEEKGHWAFYVENVEKLQFTWIACFFETCYYTQVVVRTRLLVI